MDKIFYNQASSSKLGWDPTWFGCDEFDEDLIGAIIDWQKINRLKPDGLCGPMTYRRIYTERKEKEEFKQLETKHSNHIICMGKEIPIDWHKVSLFNDGGLKLRGGFSNYGRKKRDISFFVNHWDVCLSSETCYKVLKRRGISVHFSIDNDGTIHQFMDMNDAAWHAGSKKWNHKSVGVEITNAYYLKYQSWYKRNGFGERPVISGETVHGSSMKPYTGFYDVQIKALQALWKACHEGLDIPYKCPLDKDGETLKKVSSSAAAGRFKGFVSHYHLTRRKIDCAGLDINKLLEDIKNEKH